MTTIHCPACQAKIELDPQREGKGVVCPKCGTALTPEEEVGPESPGRMGRVIALICALGLGTVVCLCVVVLAYRAYRNRDLERNVDNGGDNRGNLVGAEPAFLGVVVGNRAVAGVEDAGFYQDEETSSGLFRWTDGSARLEVPMGAASWPQAMRLNLQRPKATWLRIKVNEREIVNEPATPAGEDVWERTLDLSGLEHRDRVIIEITSNPVNMPKDGRALGVKVRGVTLLREAPGAPPAAAVPRSLLDAVTILSVGNRVVPGVEESGFHSEEQNPKGVARWTNGNARLVIPLENKRRPKAMLVRLTRPDKSSLDIKVNGRSLADLKHQVYKPWPWEMVFDLTGIELGKEMILEILSDTAEKKGKETRALGVRVLNVRLLAVSAETMLGVCPIAGIEESGFYGPELVGSEQCRWTDGAAQVTVPLRGRTPRALALAALIPDHGLWHMRVSANEKVLFEDDLNAGKRTDLWSKELPLTGVAPGDELRIQLDSATFVPSEVNPSSTDNRKLGVRLLRLKLLDGPVERGGLKDGGM